jgi:transcriptional regulator with XRE-family HTH domain
MHKFRGVIMDILLERMLSLIPRKPDGKYVHGAKKEFCEKIGAPTIVISEWESGKVKSYRNYTFKVAAVYNVDPDWLLGKTDKKEKPTTVSDDGFSESQRLLISQLRSMSPEEFEKKEAAIRAILDT